nr:transporter substrate-binding domain-containing protein [uncultured Desulfobacter sp.]
MGRAVHKMLLIGILFTVCLNIIPGEDSYAGAGRKTIRIASLEHPPVFFKDGTGAGTDMLTELLDAMGYDASIKLYPLGRAINMVNSGHIESAFLYPQTDPKVTVPLTIYYSAINFVYKKSRFPGGVNYTTLSDLNVYKIGALTNSNWSVKLLQKGAGLKLDFAPNYEMNLKQLYTERIDLLPLVDIAFMPLLESVFPNKKKEFELTKPFSMSSYCLIFSKKYPGNKNIIDDVRKKLAEIDMRDILQKHYGKYFLEGIIPPYMLTGKIIK